MILKSTRGQQALVLIFTISIVISTMLYITANSILKNKILLVSEVDEMILNETLISTFSLMESALARRFYEPPPDSNCFKSKDFSVAGSLPNGISYQVDTTYNPKTRNFEMIASGVYKSIQSKYVKFIKVVDASDYLMLSGVSNPITIGRQYSKNTATSLVGMDRKIFIKGPLQIFSNAPSICETHPEISRNFIGCAADDLPTSFGAVVQSERMQFVGGIKYIPYPVPEPDSTNYAKTRSLLAPYSYLAGNPQQYYGHPGKGASLFFKDYATAIGVTNQILSGVGPYTKAVLRPNTYPIALFSGAPPLHAWSALDDGSYFNNVDRFTTYYYEYFNLFGIRLDMTCFSKVDLLKQCSYSEHFPKGFKTWRQDAGLEGYLFTVDTEEVAIPKFTWDHLAALEEDANACGSVISTPISGSYQDCYFFDKNTLNNYINSGGDASACTDVSILDLDSVSLNQFNPNDLDDPSKKDLLLRRVIYLKISAELRQNQPEGLMASLSQNSKRNNLSLWVVSEDMLALKGVQPDTTSPLTSDPSRLREIFFNMDTVEPNPILKKISLPLTLVSPEQIHLLSPQYIAMDHTLMSKTYPLVAGKIQPQRHIRTDYLRHEEDGFKFGFRKYYLNNIAVITSQNVNPSNPFYLRGLWSSVDSSSQKFIINTCMISKAGEAILPNTPTFPINYDSPIGTYTTAPNSPIPPVGSRFYPNNIKHPYTYNAQVFNMMTGLLNYRQESDVILTGIRLHLIFGNEVPVGKWDLSTPRYTLANTYDPGFINIFDLSHKHFRYELSSAYYEMITPDEPCVPANARWLNPATAGGQTTDSLAVTPVLNEGRYIFTQLSPDNSFRNLGALGGVDMPVVEVK